MEETKKCSKCGDVLPLSEFYNNPKRKDGKQAWCKKCVLSNAKENREKRKEALSVTDDKEILVQVKLFNLGAIEKDIIMKAIRYYKDKSLQVVAKSLGISERTLMRKLNEYGVVLDKVREDATHDLKPMKTIDDYDPRELLESLWKKGYDGYFFTYVKQEMTLSKLFGNK